MKKYKENGITCDAHPVSLRAWLYCIYSIFVRRLHQQGKRKKWSLFLKSVMKVCAMFLPFLLFQSYGIGLLKFNLRPHQSFTEGLIAFWRPEFIFQIWTNIFYPLYAIGYCVLVFSFLRKVRVGSWQFLFVFVSMIVFSVIVGAMAMIKFRDIIVPIMLIVALEEKK